MRKAQPRKNAKRAKKYGSLESAMRKATGMDAGQRGEWRSEVDILLDEALAAREKFGVGSPEAKRLDAAVMAKMMGR